MGDENCFESQKFKKATYSKVGNANYFESQSQKGETGTTPDYTTYRPTVRVASFNDCVASMQTGYFRRYLPPPLQVTISQALLRELAEVRFVGNLMGLGHCVKLIIVIMCSMMILTNNVQSFGHRKTVSNFKWDLRKFSLTGRTFSKQKKLWWQNREEETPRKGLDLIPKVKINHPRSAETYQEWSGEVAARKNAVQSKELTFHEHTNSGTLKTEDKAKWKIQMAKQKVIDTRTRVGIG